MQCRVFSGVLEFYALDTRGPSPDPSYEDPRFSQTFAYILGGGAGMTPVENHWSIPTAMAAPADVPMIQLITLCITLEFQRNILHVSFCSVNKAP